MYIVRSELTEGAKMTAPYISPQKSFRTVKFAMNEFVTGTVGIHIWNHPMPCVLLRFPALMLSQPDMWQAIYALWAHRWKDYAIPQEKTCPECGAFLRNSQRIWKDRPFCQMCGTHLTDEQSMGKFWIEAI